MAKSNLAPIRPSTIQRMELNGALTAARLSRTITDELKLNIVRTVFWTDSTTVLRWINSASLKFKAYVGARIAEVLELTAPDEWHYVPTDLNPADDASRGIAPSELTINHRWFNGPDFLSLVPDQWPPSPINASEPEEDTETRSPMNIFVTVVASDRVETLLESISQLNRLIHATAYVLRWLDAAKRTPRKPVIGPITVQEMRLARNCLIRHEQRITFGKELDCLRAGRPLPSD